MKRNKHDIDSVTNSRELRVLLEGEGFSLSEVEAQRVITACRRLHKAFEDDCNGLENTLAKRHEEADLDFLRDLVKQGKLPNLHINRDPRGYPVKLELPSGRYNTWGGAEGGFGICD